MHSPTYYHRLRSKYAPSLPRLILIVESPPISGKYFYDLTGKPDEPLFKAVMLNILNVTPETKEAGLVALREAGVVLLDATYVPVNDGRADRARDEIISRVRPKLIELLRTTTKQKRIPILIIKPNVYRVVGEFLIEQKYNVINRGFAVPFPSNGHQGCFRAIVHFLLRDAGWNVPRPNRSK